MQDQVVCLKNACVDKISGNTRPTYRYYSYAKKSLITLRFVWCVPI